MQVRVVLETCLYAADLPTAEKFYTTILGLEVFAKQEDRHVFFRCGRGMFLVFNPAKTREVGTEFTPHGSEGPGHAAFAVRDDEIPKWRAHLERHGVVIEQEIAWPKGGRSLYFRDPAGHSLELASPKIWGLEEEPAG